MTLNELGAKISELGESIKAGFQKLAATTAAAISPEAFGELKANFTTLQGQFTKLEANFTTAQGEVKAATDRAVKAEADLKAANDKLSDPKGTIQAEAKKLAAELAASQGIPPVEGSNSDKPAGDDITALRKQLAAEKDPVAKSKLASKINALRRGETPKA